MKKYLALALCLVSQTFASENVEGWKHKSDWIFEPGVYSYPKTTSFGPIFESYGGNWNALKINSEMTYDWEQIAPFFTWDYFGTYNDLFEVYFAFELKRDLEAWYQDGKSSNVVEGINEFDINRPRLAWMRLHHSIFDVKLGKFPLKTGPSEQHGLLLSAFVPQDAIETKIDIGRGQYQFYLSALDPYLTGVLNNDGSYTPGTELFAQRFNEVGNQRKEVYAESVKYMFLHRFQWNEEWGYFGISEQEIQGGKYLELKDMNPLAIWHNNYASGYQNTNSSLDFRIYDLGLGSFFGEFAIDDIQFGDQEEGGVPNLLSWLVGWDKTFKIKKDSMKVLLEYVYVDPQFGNKELPLLKSTYRKVYTSNYRDRQEPEYADKYIVDYPMGYFRGSDVSDIWLKLWYYSKWGTFRWENAYLQKGEQGIETDFIVSQINTWAASGATTKEIRSRLYYYSPLLRKIFVECGNSSIPSIWS